VAGPQPEPSGVGASVAGEPETGWPGAVGRLVLVVAALANSVTGQEVGFDFKAGTWMLAMCRELADEQERGEEESAGAAQAVREYAGDLGIPLDWLLAGDVAAPRPELAGSSKGERGRAGRRLTAPSPARSRAVPSRGGPLRYRGNNVGR
jgi:hypothetical protein